MKRLLRIGWFCLFLSQASAIGFAQAGIITTYAGSAGPADGASATLYAIHNPNAVVPDGNGGFYVAGSIQHSVYRVSTDGRISLFAGNGTEGFSGDGGPAISAQLDLPYGIAVDSAGNIFIASGGNHRIRKVSTSGIITTIAGNGVPGYSGDGGPATSAQLNGPAAIAVDSVGNLYIADFNNICIRKVSISGIITTVVSYRNKGYSNKEGSDFSAQLNNPHAVAADSAGNLFIVGSLDNSVRKVSPSGMITTVAGDDDIATPDQVHPPLGVAVDSSGNLFIADSWRHRIRKVSSSGIVTTVAGNGTKGFSGDGGPATSAQLAFPYGVGVDSAGNLFITDSENNRIRKVSSSGIITTAAGNGTQRYSGDGEPAASAQLYNPHGIAVDRSGNFYITDYHNNCIRKVSPSGIITTVAGNGSEGYSGDGGSATSAQLYRPIGVAVDSTENLFIADSWNHRIRKVDTSGIITTIAGNGTLGYGGDSKSATSARLSHPSGVTLDSAGNLFITDTSNHRIRKISSSGRITTVAGNGTLGYGGDGGLATSAQLNYPTGIAIDHTGNLFIADRGNHRIRVVSPSGIITSLAGNGIRGYGGDGGPATSAQLDHPFSVAVDSAGNLLIADEGNSRIRRVSSSGRITTVAGSGVPGYSGNGGPAGLAQLYRPRGVLIDSAGNLFIADTENDCIRKVNRPIDYFDNDGAPLPVGR